MRGVIDCLRSFDAKEKFFLLGQVLGNPHFEPSSGFREELGSALGLQIPAHPLPAAGLLVQIFGDDGTMWAGVIPRFAIISPRRPLGLNTDTWPHRAQRRGSVAEIVRTNRIEGCLSL